MNPLIANRTETEQRELAAARRVLELESAALGALGDALEQGFSDAVEVLGSVAGRIIVTGMGKSGHVARKVAATLASTGSPALVVRGSS